MTESSSSREQDQDGGTGSAPDAEPSNPEASNPEPVAITSNLPQRSWPPTIVADLMTRKIITLRPDEPVGDLESGMKRLRFRHLPVVDADMKLVGLITRTDYLHALLGVAPDGSAIPKANANTLAGDIMSKNVVTAKAEYPLTTACRAMISEKLGCLPVITEDNTLVGILTETDFARLALALMEYK